MSLPLFMLTRAILTAAVLFYGVCIVLLALLFLPYSAWGLLFLGVMVLRRRRRRIALSAHGTAAWSSEEELRRAGLLDARRGGMILGRLGGVTRPGLMAGVRALFQALPAKEACRSFFRSLPGRNPAPVVRLPQAITSV